MKRYIKPIILLVLFIIGFYFVVKYRNHGVLIGMLIAYSVGILAIFQNEIRAWVFKPILCPIIKISESTTVNGVPTKYYNLNIKNKGLISARNIRVKIKSDKDKEWLNLLRPFWAISRSIFINQLSPDEEENFNFGNIYKNQTTFQIITEVKAKNQKLILEDRERHKYFLEIVSDNTKPISIEVIAENQGFNSDNIINLKLINMYNKKIILISIVLVLISLLVLFFVNVYFSRNLTVLDEIERRLGHKVEYKIDQNIRLRWIKDEYVILIPTVSNFYINKQVEKSIDYNLVPDLFEKELVVIDKVLKKRGFVLSDKNSSVDFSDRSFYDYIQSYQRDKELCSVIVNPDNLGYYKLSFHCGYYSNKDYEEQIPFLSALGLENKNSGIYIRNHKGDYYEVGIVGVRSGATAILNGDEGKYEVLYIGQEAPGCDLIEKEGIPSEVLKSIGSGSCFNDNGEYIIK